MELGDVVNQLHNKHSLADTCTSEQTDLATLGVGSEQIDNLDTYKAFKVSRARQNATAKKGEFPYQ